MNPNDIINEIFWRLHNDNIAEINMLSMVNPDAMICTMVIDGAHCTFQKRYGNYCDDCAPPADIMTYWINLRKKACEFCAEEL
jgi:hypothetical protein